MVIFLVNRIKAKTQTLNPIQITVRHLARPSSSPRQQLRVKDQSLDGCMEIEKKTRKILKLQTLILGQRNQTIPISLLDLVARRFGFKAGEAGPFVLKFSHVFQVYEHPVQRILYCRFTRKALAQMELQSRALSAYVPEVVTCLRKLLMMSKTGRVRFDHVRSARADFGLPEDFASSVILQHPQFFRILKIEEDPRNRYIECVERDPSLRVCAVERARERVYRERGVDSEDNRFAFIMKFPPGFRRGKGFGMRMCKWQRDPYWSPYEDVSGYDLRPLEAQRRMEKRAVAAVHELLSLTVEKKMLLEKIAYFKNVLDLPSKMKEFLLRHQGIFYISTRGNEGKLHTVFLKEAYRRGELIEPNDLYFARRMLGELVLMSRRSDEVDARLVARTKIWDDNERQLRRFGRSYVNDFRGRERLESCGDRDSRVVAGTGENSEDVDV